MTNPPADPAEARRHALLVVALCVPLFFAGLGARDLDLKGEPREAVTAWEMLHSGDWLLPRLNGTALPQKPLLFPWLVAGSTLLLGERSEWAARLPSALAALGAALVVWALGRRLFSARGGLLAAALFAGCLLAVSLGRRARVDMTLTFFVTLSLLLFYRLAGRAGEEEPSCPGTAALFWLALALGTLTKGPLGVVLPGMVVAGTLALERRPRDLRRLRPWPFAAILVLVAGSWYAQGLLREGRAFGSFSIFQENWRMFLGESDVHRHGPLYYVPYVFAAALPWSPFLPWAVARGFRGEGRWREVGFLFPFVWFASMFLLFSIGSAKRADYLLPVLPGAALLVAGLALEAEGRFAEPEWRRRFLVPAGILGVLGVAAAAVPLVLLCVPADRLVAAAGERASEELVREFLARATARPAFLALGAGSLLAAGLLPFALGVRGRPVRGLLAGSVGVAGTALAAAFSVLPAAEGAVSLRPFAEEVRGLVPEGARLDQHEAFRFQIGFYLGRRIPPLDAVGFEAFLAEPGSRHCLVSRARFDEVPPEGRRRVEVAARARRPGDDAGEEFLLLRAAR